MVSVLLIVAGAYLAAGVLFALPFVVTGAGHLDPQAGDGSVGFRLAILPGCVALWPLLAYRWWRGGAVPQERNAHRSLARPRP